MGTVSYNLGGVALPYADWSWPKYRGTVARVVTIDAPGGMYDDFARLAKGLAGKPTYIEVTGPAEGGANPALATLRINGVYILRVTKINKQLCQIQLADSRILLTRRVGDMDFRIVFGDGYLEGTDKATVKLATESLVQSIDVLKTNLAGGAFGDFPDVPTREKTYISGTGLPTSLGELLDYAGADLTCHNSGKFAFPGREDLAGATKLPSVAAYDWSVEPTWNAADSVILGRPREVVAYYPERHCLRLEFTDPRNTASTKGPAELHVQLDQVYSDDGEIRTLEELLVANGFASNEITDEEICKCFWSENFEGTQLSSAFGTAAFGRVHTAIRDGWRRLLRLTFPASIGHIGGWTDFAAGKIKSDGTVTPVAVECPWVEFLAEVALKDGQPMIGAPTTVNHSDDSPFGIVWEGGPETGVIRLVQKDKLRGGLAIPGALESPLIIEKRLGGNVEDNNGDPYAMNEFFVIERQDIGKARFETSFRMAVYICATRRMPNNETKWWAETVPAFSDGDIDRVELPVSGEVMAIRDYVNAAEADKFALSDGLGQVLNNLVLHDDAIARTDAWKLDHMAALDGVGIAQSIMLFRDYEVRGPINEIVLEFSAEGKVLTRMTAGNLSDTTQRERKAAKRLADRHFATAGAQ